MTKELIDAGALRQFKHNDGSDGFVCAYDRPIVDRVFAAKFLAQSGAVNVKTWQERCDWTSGDPAVMLMVQAMKAEITELRAALASGFREGRNTQDEDNGKFPAASKALDAAAPAGEGLRDAEGKPRVAEWRRDALRYRGWRDGMLASDQKLIEAMQDALPPEVGADREPTADEWDAALDIALRIGDKQGAQGDA